MGASESGATERKQPTTREGRRMSALASAYSSAIKYAMRGVDEEEFASQFPDASPELLEILWQGYRQVGDVEGGLDAQATPRKCTGLPKFVASSRAPDPVTTGAPRLQGAH